MPAKKPMPVWTDDWKSSRRVRIMTREQRSMYFDALVAQWDEPDCTLPADRWALYRLIGIDSTEAAAFEEVLRACFVEDGAVLYNPKLKRGRERENERSETYRRNAMARWGDGAENSDEVERNATGDAIASSFASDLHCYSDAPHSLIPSSTYLPRDDDARARARKAQSEMLSTEDERELAARIAPLLSTDEDPEDDGRCLTCHREQAECESPEDCLAYLRLAEAGQAAP